MERTGGAGFRYLLSNGSLRTLSVSKRPPARDQNRHRQGWRVTVTRSLIVFGFLATIVGSVWWLRSVESADTPGRVPTAVASNERVPSSPPANVLTDEHLQHAADQLLALSDPERPENAYFPDYVREHLRWMVLEHAAKRLDVAFLTEASNGPLPPEVLMAASQLDGKPAIFIAKARFMKFLVETGATEPPFSQQQKNDFALALVHEIVHLRNPAADARNLELRPAEESRVWREVNLEAVRPLLAQNQPVHRRFRDVDAALRACRDELPCPPLGRLVRLGL